MESKRWRLDRFISHKLGINRKHVRLMLAQGKVTVNGDIARDVAQIIDEFSHILCDGEVLQQHSPVYLMMHKPVGVVSATCDYKHKTVIDLLNREDKDGLHLVGRLDLNTSGLLLLTNDGRWSTALMSPENKVAKQYLVTLAKPITQEYVSAFAEGFYFEYENITTKPAKLEIVSDYQARVTIVEGRYHQIKRMFGRFRNPVVALHRESIGALSLDAQLTPSESRELTQAELELLSKP